MTKLGLVTTLAVAFLACGGSNISTNPTTSQKPSPAVTIPRQLKTTNSMNARPPAGATRVNMRRVQFVPSHLNVRAGNVSFYLVNEEPVDDRQGAYGPCPQQGCYSHNMVIVNAQGALVAVSLTVRPGQSNVFTVEGLGPGTYGFKCPVHNHDAAFNMVGTLTVS